MKPYTHKVQYYETDKMQITHHSNYIRFMEEARVDFLEQIGWGYDKMEKTGVLSPVLSITCDYKKTTTYPDIITIKIDILELKKIKFKVGYTMTVGDEIVCLGTSTHCFLNKDGKPVSIERQYSELFKILSELKKD